jgi:hypothetical protein
MKCIAESGFFSFFGGECFDRFKVKVVVKVKVVKIFSVYKKVEHIIALFDNLESCFNPVKFCELKEFGGSKDFEE